jgi:hypothetical protein
MTTPMVSHRPRQMEAELSYWLNKSAEQFDEQPLAKLRW